MTKEEKIEQYCKKFGLNVLYYRKDKGLTQKQLAELVNVKPSYISAIELGKADPPFEVIFKLCKVFDITLSQIFDFRD